MKNPSTLILTQSDVQKLSQMKRAIYAVKEAFREYALGKTQMPAKIYLQLEKYKGDFRAMPAYLEGLKSCALKWVNVHALNKSKGLPTVMALIVLSDPRNGLPLCIMDGTHITGLRTGAAGAVAAKYLANKNSHVVGLVGCGVQAMTQLEGLLAFFSIREVRLWGPVRSEAIQFKKRLRGKIKNVIVTSSVKECIHSCDIIVTTTPSRRPLVYLSWLKKGVHINAIGADAPGKQELDPHILRKAMVVIDDWEQASHSGEINVPLGKRQIGKKDIYGTLGDIIIGKKKGRRRAQDITVFDSTGLAIQDVAVAYDIYKRALKKGVGKKICFIV